MSARILSILKLPIEVVAKYFENLALKEKPSIYYPPATERAQIVLSAKQSAFNQKLFTNCIFDCSSVLTSATFCMRQLIPDFVKNPAKTE